MRGQMIPEGMMCNVFPILYVIFTGTKVNGVRAKIRQRIISHEKSDVLVSLPLFGIPGAYLCTINKNNQYG